jgi:hypothetical protein
MTEIRNPHADQLKFRTWLVKQLTLTRWSLPIDLDEKEQAKRLGVQVDVIREAQQARDSELKHRGNGGIARGRRRYIGSDYCSIYVRIPPAIRKDWVEMCAALKLEPSTVLRSLIHQFLSNPLRPQLTSSTWLYRGAVQRVKKGHECPMVRTRITRGAQQALDTHADNWSVTPTGIIRGLLTDFLEGRTKKLKIVSFAELWGDPDRYLHPENFHS